LGTPKKAAHRTGARHHAVMAKLIDFRLSCTRGVCG